MLSPLSEGVSAAAMLVGVAGGMSSMGLTGPTTLASGDSASPSEARTVYSYSFVLTTALSV